METAPSVVWDALVVPDGAEAALATSGQAKEFLRDQYRHCKPILVMGTAGALLDAVGIPAALPSGDPDPGIVFGGGEAEFEAFVDAIAAHRHFLRETHPPRV